MNQEYTMLPLLETKKMIKSQFKRDKTKRRFGILTPTTLENEKKRMTVNYLLEKPSPVPSTLREFPALPDPAN